MVKFRNGTRKFTFTRWFQHWCAYQITAFKLKAWKPIYLLHDLDKPFMNLVLSNKTTSMYHKSYSRHHIQGKNLRDIIGAIIDWECSGLTKPEAPLNARDTFYKKIIIDYKLSDELISKIEKELTRLGL